MTLTGLAFIYNKASFSAAFCMPIAVTIPLSVRQQGLDTHRGIFPLEVALRVPVGPAAVLPPAVRPAPQLHRVPGRVGLSVLRH